MEQREREGGGKFLKSKTNAMMCVKFHALHVGSALSCSSNNNSNNNDNNNSSSCSKENIASSLYKHQSKIVTYVEGQAGTGRETGMKIQLKPR